MSASASTNQNDVPATPAPILPDGSAPGSSGEQPAEISADLIEQVANLAVSEGGPAVVLPAEGESPDQAGSVEPPQTGSGADGDATPATSIAYSFPPGFTNPPHRWVCIGDTDVWVLDSTGQQVMMTFSEDFMDQLASVPTKFLNSKIADPGFQRLVISACSGGDTLSKAMSQATGRDEELEEALSFWSGKAKEAITKFKSNWAYVPQDQFDNLVHVVNSSVYHFLTEMIRNRADLEALLRFIIQSYRSICNWETDDVTEIRSAIDGYNSGLATFMLYLIWAASWYKEELHSEQPGEVSPILRWGEFPPDMLIVELISARPSHRRAGQAEAASSVGAAATPDRAEPFHRSYNYLIGLAQYVRFLGAVERELDWNSIPLWVSCYRQLSEDWQVRMIPPVLTKYLKLLAPAHPRNEFGRWKCIATREFVQSEQNFRLYRVSGARAEA